MLKKLRYPLVIIILYVTVFTLLKTLLDVRGAIDFIRMYQYTGLFISVLTSTFIVWVIDCLWTSDTKLKSITLTFILVASFIVNWTATIFLSEFLAIQHEYKFPFHTDATLSEMGYGWYYMDDSGMGGQPMSIFYFITPITLAWLVPLFIVLIITFMVTKSPLHNKTLHPTSYRG